MTHKKVWESLLLYTTRNSQPVDVHLDVPRPKGYVEFRQRYAYMVPDIDESEYPGYIYFDYRDTALKKKENLPDIFKGELGLIFVSGEMHDLLTQFHLGRTRFKEVELREYDQKTPFPGRRWFFMHIREDRKTLVPEKSVSIDPVGPEGKAWSAHPEGDNKLAIDPTNASDLDLWVDRSISDRVFFSDRLKIAIKDSGLSARWLGFRPCEIVKSRTP